MKTTTASGLSLADLVGRQLAPVDEEALGDARAEVRLADHLARRRRQRRAPGCVSSGVDIESPVTSSVLQRPPRRRLLAELRPGRTRRG